MNTDTTTGARLDAQALDALLKARNWTPRDLADRIPCTPHYIRYCLRGKRAMSGVMSRRVRSLRANARPVR